ncbi:hypothetical protein AB0N17_46455 [Streptomyces sp. NPDC051133]|uniref:hypothetical protein n=1 Tax=Streptomyces sp. NPDC051133 TaxID=3155521 RepID=UPI00341A512B
MAAEATPGAFWRGLRLMVVDGMVLETTGTQANADFFGRPRKRPGQTVAYPQLRVAALIESGTHTIVDAEIGTYHTGEGGRPLARTAGSSDDRKAELLRAVGGAPCGGV